LATTLISLLVFALTSAAILAWIFLDYPRGRKPSALGQCVGAAVGLVTIVPAAGFVNVGASLFIGIAASAELKAYYN
jgi:Amt family ammonium transporter